jgi:dTDP-4-dehydrorhamnose reductase
VKVLILGATGMLGNTALRLFAGSRSCETWGTARAATARQLFAPGVQERVVWGVDVEDIDGVMRVLLQVRPEVVINCVGLVKQHALAEDCAAAIQINALLPHRLAKLCQLANARLIHISTDCVFAGTRGRYRESESADAQDLYGRSKLLGEVDYPNALTLRTSIIGHELASVHGLVGWFLAQGGPIRGFTRAIFSGLPAVELSRVIRDYVLPRVQLRGLYHVSAAPISKFELLRLVAQVYGKAIEIVPDDEPVIDRSLDSSRFRALVGYDPPEWTDLVRSMREFG